MNEGSGSIVYNYGTIGKPGLAVGTPGTQWRSDGKFTAQAGSPAEMAWDSCIPEDASLLDSLFFFRDCTSGSPGIGGNIALVSFRLGASGNSLAQSRVITAGVAGINANTAAWEINSYGADGQIKFGRKQGFGALVVSNTLLTLAGGEQDHVVLLLDALNKDIYGWVNGASATISPTDKDSATDLFFKFTDTTDWDNNGINITIANTNNGGFTVGSRTGDTGGTKSMYGKPLGDVFFADVTALDAVLATRRDDIAAAMYASTHGSLSADVITLLTPP